MTPDSGSVKGEIRQSNGCFRRPVGASVKRYRPANYGWPSLVAGNDPGVPVRCLGTAVVAAGKVRSRPGERHAADSAPRALVFLQFGQHGEQLIGDLPRGLQFNAAGAQPGLVASEFVLLGRRQITVRAVAERDRE